MKEKTTIFGAFLKSAREKSNLSQVEFAEVLGVTKSTLCDIEKGRQFVSPVLASKMAKSAKLAGKVAVQASLQDQIDRAGLKLKVKVL